MPSPNARALVEQALLGVQSGRDYTVELPNGTKLKTDGLDADHRHAQDVIFALTRAGALSPHEFSVTTDSSLHSHKMSFTEIVAAALNFANHVKGSAILEMSRSLGFTPRTCQVFEGKIREFLIKCADLTPLQGTVHMDGAYFCGKPRKPNRKIKMPADAIAKRFGTKTIRNTSQPWIEMGMTRQNWRRQADKRVVISLCASAGKGKGSARALAFVCHSENAGDIKKLAACLLTTAATSTAFDAQNSSNESTQDTKGSPPTSGGSGGDMANHCPPPSPTNPDPGCKPPPLPPGVSQREQTGQPPLGSPGMNPATSSSTAGK